MGICVCVNGVERANEEVRGYGRKVELKERKQGDEEEEKGRWEKGGTEGYLKDISQNVGEEETEEWMERRERSQGEQRERGQMVLWNYAKKQEKIRVPHKSSDRFL